MSTHWQIISFVCQYLWLVLHCCTIVLCVPDSGLLEFNALFRNIYFFGYKEVIEGGISFNNRFELIQCMPLQSDNSDLGLSAHNVITPDISKHDIYI